MTDQAFEALKTYDWGVDPKTLQPIDEAIVASQGDNQQRRRIETKLMEILTADVPQAAVDFTCRKLRVIGTAASVPALARLLDNDELAHMARFALQSIPDPEATQALQDAVGRLDGQLKVGVLSSLGARNDAGSIGVIARCLNDADAQVADAAAHALGALGKGEAAQALAEAEPNSNDTREAVVDSSLACAEQLLEIGDQQGAAAIYQRLATTDQPKHVRIAATRGMMICKR